MAYDQNMIPALYKKLITLYPRGFRERLGESMEQTFHDLYQEQQIKTGRLGFLLCTFIETAIGIFREHLLLVSSGDIMQTTLKTIGTPGLISLLIILPFIIMEIVNRRNLNEEFPFMLFFVMWLNLFAVSVILLPIVRAMRSANQDLAHPLPAQKNSLLTNPRSAVILSVVLFLSPGILPLLEYFGWLSTDRLFNGPNPEAAYLPGMFMALILILFPVAAGVVAGRPVVNTLQAGGRLFAHPINLIIVVAISFLFASGLVSLIVDQWPCFIGVPNCD